MSVRNVTGRRCCLVAWSLLAFALGCATSGQHYTAKTVPASLLATKRENAQTLDLTRLARASKDSDSIDRGDVIEVSISAGLDEDDTITLPVRINDEGIANLPELGPIKLAGMEMEAAEAAIVAMCIENKLYVRPNVTVTMKRQRMNRVMVVGAVKSPDVYELPRGRSDLLAAIVAAGGLEKDAGTKVEIRNPRRPGGRSTPIASGLQPGIDTVGHSSGDLSETTLASTDPDIIPVIDADGKMESYKVDLVSATKAGKGGYIIEDGGVISIEKRDPEPLHVIGLVRKPDRYDFPIAEDLRVTDAIALAGGTSMPVADRVFIVRRVPKSNETAVIQVSLRQAKRNAQANMSLEPGDVVSVENTPTTVLYEAINIIKFNISAGATLGSGLF
ncbi:MAG: SLBB domain-containing protein [Planctomycetaceae bacterium]